MVLRSLAILIAALLLTSAAPVGDGSHGDDKLVVLSVSDMMGRIKPCGCEVPKGGFARQQAFADSVRRNFSQVLLVDNGGYFPDSAGVPTAVFMMETLKHLNYDAVGTGPRDLKFGLDLLRDHVRRLSLPQTSANLYVRALDKPVFPTYVMRDFGKLKVGMFSLISDRMDLGPSRAQLVVKDPYASAAAAIAAMKARGATVIVLLSQLGKIDTEELVTAVEGVDVAIVGLNAPVNPQGRMLGRTLLTYAGEQGQHMGAGIVVLDPTGRMATATSEVHKLVKEVGEKQELLDRVKAFEESQKTAVVPAGTNGGH